jgi:branched-chain amino acid transport system substrate-binding protein
MYLCQVKSLQESNSKDNIYKLLASVPADEASRPLKDGKHPDIK